MTLRLILGIDPGQTGAIALFADGEPAGFIDMPTHERAKGGGRQVDGHRLAASLRGVLHQHTGAHVVVVTERVQAMGKSPGASMFRFGQADGIVRGVLGALGLPLLEVEPQTWKRHFGLLKTEKTDARQYAMRRWPTHAIGLLQAKQDGRSDALLVAAWAYETEAWVPQPEPKKRKSSPKPKRTDAPHPVIAHDLTPAP